VRRQTSGPSIAQRQGSSRARGCEPEGGPDACVIVAHDPATGKELWRTRTIPRPGEPGSESWADLPDAERQHVGMWMVPSYDPELNLIYVGTSVTSPGPKFMLGGNDKQYLYHNSTLAINPDTGKIVWHYQHLVDHWDLDHTVRAPAGRHAGGAQGQSKWRGSTRASSRARSARS
jgi:outer membrane protein assembly factor BamB